MRLDSVVGSMRESTNGWWIFDCPLCDQGRNKEKAAVNYEYGFMKCWECGMRYFIDHFLREVEGFSYADSIQFQPAHKTYKLDKVSEMDLPEGFKLISEKSEVRNRVFKYINKRGFSLGFLNSKAVGYSDSGDLFGYLIIPVVNRGKLVYWVARDAYNRSLPKYLNAEGPRPFLYNLDSLYTYDTVYHTEGIIDSWTIGNNCVASLGWAVTSHQINEIISSPCRNYIIVPDPGYESKAYDLGSKLSRYKNVYIKDTGAGDVNTIGLKAFKELPIKKFSYKSWISI